MPKDQLMEPVETAPSAPDAERVEGVPVWYFALAGALVASGDLVREYQSAHPWVLYVPTALVFVHLGLWFTVLKQRRRYWKAVVRSPKARVLAVCLAVLRVALGMALASLYAGPHEHLILGLTMLVVVPVSAWIDQTLILRALRNGSKR